MTLLSSRFVPSLVRIHPCDTSPYPPTYSHQTTTPSYPASPLRATPTLACAPCDTHPMRHPIPPPPSHHPYVLPLLPTIRARAMTSALSSIFALDDPYWQYSIYLQSSSMSMPPLLICYVYVHAPRRTENVMPRAVCVRLRFF
ncbi:hypothetical protein GY45DRAFT_378013 [Cubamyces sp. BRFM 1775]|nr:hypothetical protein GY45DRAFT_378013 [Cubamyces sp. BRFM 1775]